MKILIIDNYDSFVYNIAQTLGKHNITTFVYRNDNITLNQIKKMSIDAIIISPGPGNPEDKKYFGICNNVIKILGKEITFEDVKNPFVATRYHSLIADKETFPNCLEITAKSVDDNEIMAITHKKYPIKGVQFHPESILTGEGSKILNNFISFIKK